MSETLRLKLRAPHFYPTLTLQGDVDAQLDQGQQWDGVLWSELLYPLTVKRWLLLDSRVVDMPMASTPNFVTFSSLQPLFFHSLKNAFCFSDNAGA